ncbi:uncharacterized protein LOC129766978 [Toxorhynchites rutilus septentrionalis]|uniref:uncharacterized protein LOC129766978 n=1 Tax=Toxorhynchites rutilus septentrionalis TaxID=329112 RepID=UPI00247A15CC|nr:uncharacterized protein LOC129766978 [Toxorhynchites rutilus septentrionalis]
MVRKYIRKTTSKYTKEELDIATAVMRNGKITLADACRFYRIPKTTLFRHAKGLSGIKSSSKGRSIAIPLDIESNMATNIKTMAKWGYGLCKKEIIIAMKQYLEKNSIKTPFKNGIPGDDYFLNVKRRHNLSQKKPQSVEVARKRAADPFVISQYFELVQEVTHNMPPDRIYNIDETSFCLDPSRVKVVGQKGRAAHRVTAGSGKENFTVLMGGNAVGQKLPPLIIFKGKSIWNSWMAKSDEEFVGMTYAATANGWMENGTFSNYFQRSFLPAIGNGRPAALIYDGHVSHISLNIVEMALKENIVILKLPPHTSHLPQPMDLAVFKPFKLKYDNAIIKWQRKNYGVKISKQQFSTIISRIWHELDPQMIRSGFKKAGIFPFDNKVIPETTFEPAALERFKKSKQCPMVPLPTDAIYAQSALPNFSIESALGSIPIENAIVEQSTQIEKVSKITEHSFEAVLLEHVKQESNRGKSKRKRVCPGAEVITSPEAVTKLQKIEYDKRTKTKKGRK